MRKLVLLTCIFSAIYIVNSQSNIEGYEIGQFFDISDQIVLFGNGPGYANNIGFLKGGAADDWQRNLSGNADKRDRVHHCG